MPLYDYECRNCKDKTEVYQGMSEDPLTKCEKCGGEIRRIINTCHGFVVGKTLGSLADKNTSSMSDEERRKKMEEFKTKKTINRIPEHLRPKTVEEPPPRKLQDWEKKARTKDTKEVAKMSDERLKKYINTGE